MEVLLYQYMPDLFFRIREMSVYSSEFNILSDLLLSTNACFIVWVLFVRDLRYQFLKFLPGELNFACGSHSSIKNGIKKIQQQRLFPNTVSLFVWIILKPQCEQLNRL